VVNQLPETPSITPAAYTSLGVAYTCLRAPEEAIPFFEKVASSYPDYERADYALLSVARNFRRLAGEGRISVQEADVAIQPLYERFLERYPTSSLSKIVTIDLERVLRRTHMKGGL
jgi:hypothetical protein